MLSDLVRYCIPVLDLDETLVHCKHRDMIPSSEFDAYLSIAAYEECSLPYLERRVFYLRSSDGSLDMILILRKYARACLEYLNNHHYRTIIWSASSVAYVESVKNVLYHPETKLPEPLAILSWHDCMLLPFGQYAKPLQMVLLRFPELKLSLEQLILIDNRRENSYYNPLHWIEVPDFVPNLENKNQETDRFLKETLPQRIAVLESEEHKLNRISASRSGEYLKSMIPCFESTDDSIGTRLKERRKNKVSLYGSSSNNNSNNSKKRKRHSLSINASLKEIARCIPSVPYQCSGAEG